MNYENLPQQMYLCTQMSELNLNDYDVFPQARIDVFYCNKPSNFILRKEVCISVF